MSERFLGFIAFNIPNRTSARIPTCFRSAALFSLKYSLGERPPNSPKGLAYQPLI